MGSTTIAVDTLDRLAVQLAGIQEAAKQLREIGPIQDAVADFTKQRDALLAEIEAAKIRHTDILAGHLQELGQAKQDAASVKRDAQKLLQAAKESAAKIVADAAQQAALDLQAEKVNREQILKDVQQSIDAEKKQLSELLAKTAQAQTDARDAEERARVATAALEKIQKQARALIG
jgi:prophage DNA circulation protein